MPVWVRMNRGSRNTSRKRTSAALIAGCDNPMRCPARVTAALGHERVEGLQQIEINGFEIHRLPVFADPERRCDCIARVVPAPLYAPF